MNQTYIVPESKADLLLPKLAGAGMVCYYLDEDVGRFLALRSALSGQLEVRNLSGSYYRTFQEIADSILELMARLNEQHDSLDWWGGQVASKNPVSSDVQKLITRLFCVRKLLFESTEDLVFVTSSAALSESISTLAAEKGLEVVNHVRPINVFFSRMRLYGFYVVQLLYHLQLMMKNKWSVWRHLKRPSGKKQSQRKRILIRSWVTQGNFSESGIFKDRNFGDLPTWLKDQGYEVWTLPMFFNLGPIKRDIYKRLQEQEQTFVVPEHYLGFRDYVMNLMVSLRALRMRIRAAKIDGVDVSLLFNEVIVKIGVDVSMATLNLSYFLIKRLKAEGVQVDGFYYAFENNASEKLFLLGCRKYYKEARLLGYQHTAYYSDHLAFKLSPGELRHHPLPDRIVCSGRKYQKILEQAGFPREKLWVGPNLRYTGVYGEKESSRKDEFGRKNLLLPFTNSQNLAFELIYKTWQAVGKDMEFQVFVRSHPLLSTRTLIDFMEMNRLADVEFADGGGIQEWFEDSFAVISTGTSITILEAVAHGVPVIRVIPDNTFLLDPLIWENYPLQPVSQVEEIREQLRTISRIKTEDNGYFARIGKKVLEECFARTTAQNMKLFDLNSEHWILPEDANSVGVQDRGLAEQDQ